MNSLCGSALGGDVSLSLSLDLFGSGEAGTFPGLSVSCTTGVDFSGCRSRGMVALVQWDCVRGSSALYDARDMGFVWSTRRSKHNMAERGEVWWIRIER